MKKVKKWRVPLFIFMLSLFVGFMGMWVGMLLTQNTEEKQQNIVTYKKTQEDVEKTLNSAVKHKKSQVTTVTLKRSSNQNDLWEKWNAWDKDVTYLGGDEVSYRNKVYRAKWWTLGEIPGETDVWEDTKQEAAVIKEIDDPREDAKIENDSKSKTDKKQDDSDFKVVGYFPSWKPLEAERIRYDVLTHVIYAFAIPTVEGGLRPLENADTAKRIIQDVHANGAKVLLAVGGWSYQDVPLEATFMSATKNFKTIKKFGNAIIRMCEKYGFDGIDMDWEHPRMDGNAYKQYEDLMLYLSKELHNRGKILTSAVMSGATPDATIYYDSAAHTDKVLDAVDWIHVMAYDGGDGDRHSSYTFAKNCGTYWHDTRGLAPEKVVLGVPFYGRPSWASYRDILQEDSLAWKSDKAQINGMTAYYNGISTIKKKTMYAKKELGGIMIWEITQDSFLKKRSLLTAIGEVVGTGK